MTSSDTGFGPKSSGSIPSIRANTECIGECRIGAVAPMSDTLRMSGGSGMAPSSRDRICVDLQGLKAALCAQAQAAGVLPSEWVRAAVADALGRPAVSRAHQAPASIQRRDATRARLSLRMTRPQALAVLEAASRAGMAPGDYVANLVAGVPVATCGYRRPDHVAALTGSCAEMSSFSRSLHRLTSLLRNGSFRVAQDYQAMLDRLDDAVESHLRLTSRALADLRPHACAGSAPKRARR